MPQGIAAAGARPVCDTAAPTAPAAAGRTAAAPAAATDALTLRPPGHQDPWGQLKHWQLPLLQSAYDPGRQSAFETFAAGRQPGTVVSLGTLAFRQARRSDARCAIVAGCHASAGHVLPAVHVWCLLQRHRASEAAEPATLTVLHIR